MSVPQVSPSPTPTPTPVPIDSGDRQPAPRATVTPAPHAGATNDTFDSTGASKATDRLKQLSLDLWNDLAGDDINVMRDPSAPLWQKGLAGVDLASTVIDPAKGAAETLLKSAGKAAVKKVVSSEILRADGANASATQGTYNGTAASKIVTDRVNELRDTLPKFRRGLVTYAAAVAVDSQGNSHVLISSNEPGSSLRDEARRTLKPGEMTVKADYERDANGKIKRDADGKAIKNHAEVNIVNFAKKNGLAIVDIGATSKICVPCQDALKDTGVHYSTPLREK